MLLPSTWRQGQQARDALEVDGEIMAGVAEADRPQRLQSGVHSDRQVGLPPADGVFDQRRTDIDFMPELQPALVQRCDMELVKREARAEPHREQSQQGHGPDPTRRESVN
jgi:hypothetical protein